MDINSLLEILNLKQNAPIAVLAWFIWHIISSLKIDLKEVRTELKSDISSLRTEINSIRTELKAEINSVRSELKEDIREVKNEVKTLSNNLNVLDRTVIRFESTREAENKIEKMLNDAIISKSQSHK